jgi:hypothetical protein
MSTTPSAVRQAIEARVLTTVLSSGDTLAVSSRSYLDFRAAAKSPRHLEYAVGTLSSENTGERGGTGGLALVKTDIRVLVAFHLGAHDGMLDNTIDDALTVEDEIRRHVNEQTALYPLTFRTIWKRSERTNLGPSGWVAIESVWEALHYLAM